MMVNNNKKKACRLSVKWASFETGYVDLTLLALVSKYRFELSECYYEIVN